MQWNTSLLDITHVTSKGDGTEHQLLHRTVLSLHNPVLSFLPALCSSPQHIFTDHIRHNTLLFSFHLHLYSFLSDTGKYHRRWEMQSAGNSSVLHCCVHFFMHTENLCPVFFFLPLSDCEQFCWVQRWSLLEQVCFFTRTLYHKYTKDNWLSQRTLCLIKIQDLHNK